MDKIKKAWRIAFDKYGDYPEARNALMIIANAMEVNNNKITEILQHKIEWWLADDTIEALDDLDIEHITYMITQGWSEGELNHGSAEIRGYWKIIKN